MVTVMGITKGQRASGERRVIGLILPPKKTQNSLVTLKAVKALTNNSTNNSKPLTSARRSPMRANAQKPPKGGSATKLAAPTR